MTHQAISFVKSGMRILGYIALPFSILGGVVILVTSEIMGIVEEFGED